ncbi:hypothetical protein SAMN04489867_1245 [Pedococcus dokdonensis]|uniref:Uncharacterized protein n=2 Tax=Pedococcus dokdonensis TaxID=443156 RepID=A0A1H0PGF2_9MICO|nr:hypothetical protein SAMN04489867_1245 [Pedococcus dokdonensis]
MLQSWFAFIDAMQAQQESAHRLWPVEPGSSIALDDDLTSPLQVGHQVQRLIHVASDHLTAIRRLLGGEPAASQPSQGVVSVYADYTLVRGALEAAMLGHWILLPSDRIERVRRCLTLMSQDFFDEYKAAERLSMHELGGPQVLAEAKRRHDRGKAAIERVAAQAGIYGPIPRLRIEQALSEVDAATARQLLLMWKIASGMTHGRLWAGLTMSTVTEMADHGDDTVTIRTEGNLLRVTVAVGDAVSALKALLRLFELRRTVPACSG